MFTYKDFPISNKGETMELDLEAIKEERAFLHDLATPLMVAIGMVDFAIRNISKEPEDEKTELLLKKLDKSKNALNKITALLKNRRSLLVSKTPS